MSTRRVWVPTLLQPAAASAIIALGWATNDGYPAGTATEGALIAALVLVAFPGLVVAVADAVRGARHARPGEKPAYQRSLDAIAPRGETAPMEPSLVADVAARLVWWGLLQAGLAIAVGGLIMLTPLDEGWGTAAFFPGLLGLAAVTLVLVGVMAWLAVAVLRFAVRPRDRGRLVDVPDAPEELNARRPVLFGALLASLGAMLLGLVAFAILGVALIWVDTVDLPPTRRGEMVTTLSRFSWQYEGELSVWIWLLRITTTTVLAGLVGVLTLGPLAFYRMIVRPAREAPSEH